MTEIHLFGSLLNRFGKCHDLPITLNLKKPAPLIQVLTWLDIPLDQVQLAMIDHQTASRHSLVAPGGRVALFSKEYPIFADWKKDRF